MMKRKCTLRFLKLFFIILTSSIPVFLLNASWSTPTVISSVGSDQPDIAVDSAGNAVAIWQGFDGSNYVIQASKKPSNGSWSSPTTLSVVGQNAQSPEVGMDRSGNAVGIWSRYDGTNSIVQGVSSSFGSLGWSTPLNISAAGANADNVELAMDYYGNVGNAVAVWHRYNHSNFIIQASNLPSGGQWETPMNISASGGDALVPEVAVDSVGNAIIVYCRFDGAILTTRAVTQLNGQSWSPSCVLSTPEEVGNQPDVAVDGSGNAWVAWSQYNGSNYVIQTAALDFGGSLSSTNPVSNEGEDAFTPLVALDPLGNGVIVWVGFDGLFYSIQASVISAGGLWSEPIRLSSSGQNVGNIDVAIDPSGNAIAVWDASNEGASVIQAATLIKGETWSNPVTISTEGKNANLPVLDVDSAGNAEVIWLESDGADYFITGSMYSFNN